MTSELNNSLVHRIETQHAPGLAEPDPADADLVDRIFDYIVTQLPEAAEKIPNIDSLKSDVRAEFAGSMCYVAAKTRNARSKRAAEFMRMFDGTNAKEVARHLKIGKTTAYRLIRQVGRAR